MSGTGPGSRPRGEQRRSAITRAASRVLLRDGFGGLSHRAVAAEAGVPLGSTTYYFSGRDDLARAAVGALLEQERRRRDGLDAQPVRDRPGMPGSGVADRLLALLLPPDLLPGDGAAAFYQRWAEASRDPALASLLAADLEDLRARVGTLLAGAGSPAPVDAVLALADGRVLHALVEGGDAGALADRLAGDLASWGAVVTRAR